MLEACSVRTSIVAFYERDIMPACTIWYTLVARRMHLCMTWTNAHAVTCKEMMKGGQRWLSGELRQAVMQTGREMSWDLVLASLPWWSFATRGKLLREGVKVRRRVPPILRDDWFESETLGGAMVDQKHGMRHPARRHGRGFGRLKTRVVLVRVGNKAG